MLYLIVAAGAGLIGLRFLQSTLKVRKMRSPTTMGFLFSGIFLLLATTTLLLGLNQTFPAFAALTAAATLSLLLVRYILFIKTPWRQVFFFAGSLAVTIGTLTLFFFGKQSMPALLFLLHAITLIPLFFVFHHYFLLSRDAETKTKSFWFMTLMPIWLGSISVPLVFAPFFPVNLWTGNLTIGVLGVLLLSFVLVPLFRLPAKKYRISPAPPKMMEFLNAF